MEVVALAVQIILATIAGWYAWETRLMRQQDIKKMEMASEELELMRRQLRQVNAPCLATCFVPDGEPGDPSFRYSEFTGYIVRYNEKKSAFAFNITSFLIYDGEFYYSNTLTKMIDKDDGLPVELNPTNKNGISIIIRDYYGEEALNKLAPYLIQDCIITLYCDINSNLYVNIKMLSIKDKKFKIVKDLYLEILPPAN